MDFGLSPEQEELVKTLRAFARKELAPQSRDWDRTGDFPWPAWKQMGELGLLGLRIPAAYGGQDADLMTFGLAMEEVKRRWLPPTARGEEIIALALTEPGAGSDAAHLSCRAERDGESYVITGEKSGISLAMAAQSAVLFARTGSTSGARGVTAFLVPLELPGVSRSRLRDMGSHCVGRAVLSFDHVRVPISHRLGDEGQGFYQVMRGFDYNRVGIALASLGVAQVSLEETMAYVKERRAFGKPLATFEGISFPIAEPATQIDAGRGLCHRALCPADQARPYSKESAMTKWWGPKLPVETIHQCLLFHGHYGYTDELPFEQRMRDVIGLEIGDGTAEVMKTIVARELMGRESRPY